MTTEALLLELETLSDPDRIRRMIALGRQARTDPQVSELLEELAAGGFYERRLALLACTGSGDGAHALRALTDPSRLLRGLAIRLIPALCTDNQAVEALDASPLQVRVALLVRLLRQRRQAPVDAFLTRMADRHDPDLGRLLPYGSSEAVRRLLGAVMDRFGPSEWARLARHHPDLALEELRRQAESLTDPDARLRHHAAAVLDLLAVSRPDGALALVAAILRQASIAQLPLQRLADRRPNEVAKLILASEDRAAIRFDSVAHRLTTENLLALIQQRPEMFGHPALWLRRLRPEVRRSAYGAAGLSWRNTDGVVEIAAAALLPGELRVDEGRRHLALRALATRPAQRIPYASLLPWAEAREALEPDIRSPDATLRSAALSALIGAVRYQRERLPEALQLVRARANEQDPVRGAMMTALAALPPGRWMDRDLDDLESILGDALKAADLSVLTSSAAEKLVVSLIPFHPDRAAALLGTLVRERGQISFHNLGERLSDNEVRRIAPALLPVLESWQTREREVSLLHAAQGLGRRLRALPELVEILERVLIVTPRSHIASQILFLLARYRPDRLHALVPSLLAQDPSAATLPVVYLYLHRRRQDLLTPFLGQQAHRGRFSSGMSRFVLPLDDGFQRWTPSQQKTFARTLHQVTRDSDRDMPTKLRVIKQLSALPAIRPTQLITLADLSEEKQALRDAALRALARLDSGEGVPVLVAALEDERSRVAIYALRSALLEMPAGAALALLRGIPMDRVTVAKGVVRLLGDLKTPDAYPDLLALDPQDGAGQPPHRDVRVALLRALWNHLEEDATWPILMRAAANPDPAAAGGVTRIPTDRLSAVAQHRLVQLMAALLDHPDAGIRMDVLRRCVDLPLPDPTETLLPRLLSGMGSPLPDESAAAARAVFATYTGRQADAVGQAIRAIRENRRALQASVESLKSSLFQSRGRLQATVRAVLDSLKGDPVTATLRAELAVCGLPGEEMASLFIGLAENGELHSEALVAAVRGLERKSRRQIKLPSPRLMAAIAAIAPGVPRTGDDGLERFEAALSGSPDERLRRIALASLVAQAARAGWTEDFRRRLEAFRIDPSPLVAAAAQFTFPPEEPDDPAAGG